MPVLLEELKSICKNQHLDNRTNKTRLKLKLGNKIIIAEKPGKLTFICFLDNHSNILNQAYAYQKESQSKEKERFRILKTVCYIIDGGSLLHRVVWDREAILNLPRAPNGLNPGLTFLLINTFSTYKDLSVIECYTDYINDYIDAYMMIM
jgi:hypothetical protein